MVAGGENVAFDVAVASAIVIVDVVCMVLAVLISIVSSTFSLSCLLWLLFGGNGFRVKAGKARTEKLWLYLCWSGGEMRWTFIEGESERETQEESVGDWCVCVRERE